MFEPVIRASDYRSLCLINSWYLAFHPFTTSYLYLDSKGMKLVNKGIYFGR